MKDVIVVVGSGSIAQAIARRVSVGKHVLLGRYQSYKRTAGRKKRFSRAGFEVSTTIVDVSSRQSIQQLVKTACNIGNVKGIIHTGRIVTFSGESTGFSSAWILYGSAVLFEEFGKVIAPGGSCVVIGFAVQSSFSH
ncbi:short chain dehydrogenase [Klebsiella variicola]|nr:short chain dehydrogenase [Klebsiella variicola]